MTSCCGEDFKNSKDEMIYLRFQKADLYNNSGKKYTKYYKMRLAMVCKSCLFRGIEFQVKNCEAVKYLY